MAGVRAGLLSEIFVMSFDTLRGNKMRSALTVLGVVIGITSIVGMTSLIRGFDRHGQEVVHAWGMTETSPVGTVFLEKANFDGLGEDERYRLRAMQGLPSPGIDARIVGDAGVAPHDGKTMGELQFVTGLKSLDDEVPQILRDEKLVAKQ